MDTLYVLDLEREMYIMSVLGMQRLKLLRKDSFSYHPKHKTWISKAPTSPAFQNYHQKSTRKRQHKNKYEQQVQVLIIQY